MKGIFCCDERKFAFNWPVAKKGDLANELSRSEDSEINFEHRIGEATRY